MSILKPPLRHYGLSIIAIYKKQLGEKNTNQEQAVVSWGIFLATLAILLITLTAVIFPALLIRTIGGFENYANVNAFETGVCGYPLVITNFVIFGIVILYLKNRLPQLVIKSIRFIFNFEISAKIAFIVVAVLLGIYTSFTVGELSTEEPWEDYHLAKEYIENWTINEVSKGVGSSVKYFLLSTSFNVFGNTKVIPFIASISLLVLTYFITAEISKKRFSGIVAMIIVLQSSIFLTYDTSVAYENFWILLYLLSLYMVYKKWPLSPVSYILSILSKTLTAAFFPMTLFFIYRSNISRQKKIGVTISYGIIIVLMGIGFFVFEGDKLFGGVRDFNSHDFWVGFNAVSLGLRFDGLVLVLLLPLTVGLFIASRKGIAHGDSIMVLIMGMLLVPALLTSFTYMTNQPYRFISLIVFFAIGIGTILSKNINEQTLLLSTKQ